MHLPQEPILVVMLLCSCYDIYNHIYHVHFLYTATFALDLSH